MNYLSNNNNNIYNRDKKIFEGLFKIAETIPKVSHVRLVAAIVLKNDIISIGHCQLKTHPLQALYSKNPKSIFLHAEIHAIQRALKIITVDEIQKATLYICRIKKINNILSYGTSCPCSGCLRAIEQFNINKVLYTNNGTELSWSTLMRDNS